MMEKEIKAYGDRKDTIIRFVKIFNNNIPTLLPMWCWNRRTKSDDPTPRTTTQATTTRCETISNASFGQKIQKR